MLVVASILTDVCTSAKSIALQPVEVQTKLGRCAVGRVRTVRVLDIINCPILILCLSSKNLIPRISWLLADII